MSIPQADRCTGWTELNRDGARASWTMGLEDSAEVESNMAPIGKLLNDVEHANHVDGIAQPRFWGEHRRLTVSSRRGGEERRGD
jgi:hypothetical protein